MLPKKKMKKMKKMNSDAIVSTFQTSLIEDIGIRNLTFHIVKVKEFWTSLVPAERVWYVLKITRLAKRNNSHPLYKCLNSLKNSVLNNRFSDMSDEKKNLSRNVLIRELIAKFYGEVTPLEKRAKEESNIKSFSTMISRPGHVTMSGIHIPHELSRLILSYLPRNIDILVKVGGVCKIFYIIILSSFGTIKVTIENVSSISIFALNFSKRVSICNSTRTIRWTSRTGGTWKGKGRQRRKNTEGGNFDQIWNNLKADHLRVIEIYSNSEEYSETVLKSIRDFISKNKECNPFVNVTQLIIRDYPTKTASSPKKKKSRNGKGRRKQACVSVPAPRFEPWVKSNAGFKLTTLFPKLEMFEGMTTFGQLNEEFVRGEVYPGIKEIVMFPSNYDVFKSHKYEIFGLEIWEKTLPNLRKVSFLCVRHELLRSGKCQELLNNLIHLKVNELEIEIDCVVRRAPSLSFSKDSIISIEDLIMIIPIGWGQGRDNKKKLIIREMPSTHSKSSDIKLTPPRLPRLLRSSDICINPINPSKSFANIREIQIHSTKKRENWWYPMDFNMMKLLETNFFTDYRKYNLKVFKGQIPFRSPIQVLGHQIGMEDKGVLDDPEVDYPKIVSSIFTLLEFFKNDCIEKYDEFDLLIMARNVIFHEESIRFHYQKDLRRFRIFLQSSAREIDQIFSSNDNKDGNSLVNTLANILKRERRLCRMIFQLFLNSDTMKSMSRGNNNNIHIFVFGFSDDLHSGNKRTILENYLEKKVKLEDDFVFERDGLCFFREYLK